MKPYKNQENPFVVLFDIGIFLISAGCLLAGMSFLGIATGLNARHLLPFAWSFITCGSVLSFVFIAWFFLTKQLRRSNLKQDMKR